MRQILKTQLRKTCYFTAVMILFMCAINITGVRAGASSGISKPTVTIVSRTVNSINVKIKKVSGVTGYQIYRSETKSGSYKKIKTTKRLTYKDTSMKNSKVYYYKVRAYLKKGSTIKYSSFSKVVKAATVPGNLNGFSAASWTGSVQLSWLKVSTASSYRIYRSTKSTGGFTYLKSVKGTSYSDETGVSGKVYYYKIRAYKKASGTKYYGGYSNIVEGTVLESNFSSSETNTGSNNSSNGVNTGSSTAASSYAAEVLNLVNAERAKNGLSPLKASETLTNAANQRAKEIVTKFAHERPDGTSCFTVLAEYGISYKACGENIAYGQKTPEEVMNAWMNSEGHRRNILSSSFGTLGVGYYVSNNTIYWVQLFTD